MFFKKNKTIVIVSLAIIVIAGFALQKNENKALAADYGSLTGYAWSDNIGWVQMSNSANTIKVDLTSGDLTGYAWSDNIGWINFAPAGPFPTDANNPQTPVKANLSTGELSGWAQVVSIKDCSGGWTGCGWIEMKSSSFGLKYDLNTGKIDATQAKYKWAWSDDFGWFDFSQTSLLGVNIISADSTYVYFDHYIYPKGIIVNTYADAGNGVVTGNAAITKGEGIYYTLEISNQGSEVKTINLKFTIPQGYKFDPATAGVSCTAIATCPNPTPVGTLTGPTQITWGNLNVPVGMSTVKFKLGT
jgi:hypothetical protein